jgi:hypothetical protein
MAKPAITKRVTKGSALSYSELDTNFQNLADATVSLTAGSGGTAVSTDLNGNITVVAGTGISLTGNNTAKTLTITNTGLGGNSFETIRVNDATNVVADSIGDTLLLLASGSVTLTANPGADSITITGTKIFGEIQTASTIGTLSYYPSGISGDAANKTLANTLLSYSASVDTQTITATNALTLVANGAINVTPANNTNILLNTAGTGNVQIGGSGTLICPGSVTTAAINNAGAGVIIDSGTVGITSSTNADVYITPNGTGNLNVIGDLNLGKSNAGTLIKSNWNNADSFVRLRCRNDVNTSVISVENNIVNITAGSQGNFSGFINLTHVKTSGAVRIVEAGNGATSLVGAGSSFSIKTEVNGNLILAPNGSGKTQIKNAIFNEVRYLINDGNPVSGTLSIDAANGSIQYVNINGNITINGFANPVTGQTVRLIVESNDQYTLTAGADVFFAGGNKTLTDAGTDIITMFYTGVDYFAKLDLDFS